MKIKIGLEKLLERPKWLKGRRMGLLCHQASTTSKGHHARFILKKCYPEEFRIIFCPQHGLFGDKQANMIGSEDFIDKATGLPVISLYGPRLRPEQEHLSEIDVLLVDLQDIGCRVYTYIWTVLLCMEACAKAGVEVIILDRPNPLGYEMEGPILEKQLFSFVGLASIPMRHGLTIGELARYLLSKKGLDLSLQVVKIEGWYGDLFPETKLPWIMPSPNIPSFWTALVYPGQVLLEGTNLSEGRGTTRPFEIFGAPYLKVQKMIKTLDSIAGVRWQEIDFIPVFDKWKGRVCHGLQIHVVDPYGYKPVFTSLAILRTVIKWHDEFAWRQPPYEFEWQHLPFDIIVGSQKVRKILKMDISLEELKELCCENLKNFQEEIKPFRLYGSE